VALCIVCGDEHQRSPVCERLRDAANALDLYAVPGFLTDPRNRIIWANRAFNDAVGLAIAERQHERFVPAAIMGPLSDRFPRRFDEVSLCLPGLQSEVSRGKLAPSTLGLVESMFERYPVLAPMVQRDPTPWDGTVVLRSPSGETAVLREQVVPLADVRGKPNGFHLSLWFAADRDASVLDGTSVVLDASPQSLTGRQLEIALLYASGLSSNGVAARAGVAPRTARSHLEAVYQRLGVHSRAELAATLMRHGLS
jgi:DNA-binding CsgD family transcriptional regulator